MRIPTEHVCDLWFSWFLTRFFVCLFCVCVFVLKLDIRAASSISAIHLLISDTQPLNSMRSSASRMELKQKILFHKCKIRNWKSEIVVVPSSLCKRRWVLGDRLHVNLGYVSAAGEWGFMPPLLNRLSIQWSVTNAFLCCRVLMWENNKEMCVFLAISFVSSFSEAEHKTYVRMRSVVSACGNLVIQSLGAKFPLA